MPFATDAGALRTPITFQEPTLAVDPGGAQSPTWANVGTNPSVWSAWVYDHGQEQAASGADVSTQRATVTVRYRSDILATWRVYDGSNYWSLIAPPEHVQRRNHWTVLRVELVKGTV